MRGSSYRDVEGDEEGEGSSLLLQMRDDATTNINPSSSPPAAQTGPQHRNTAAFAAAAAAAAAAGGTIAPPASNGSTSILLPTSFLALHTQLEDSPNPNNNNASSSVLFASTQLLDSNNATPISPLPHHFSGTHPSHSHNHNWIDRAWNWIAAPGAVSRENIPLVVRSPGHSSAEPILFDIQAGMSHNPSPTLGAKSGASSPLLGSSFAPFELPPRPSSTELSSGPSTPSAASSSPNASPVPLTAAEYCYSCLNSAVLLSLVFFALFLGLFAFEYHMEKQVRTDRMSLLELPAHARLNLNYDVFLEHAEKSLGYQKEIHKALAEIADKDSTIHLLQSELSDKDEVLASYKKVVQRLKALQTEHAEMEKRIREAAIIHESEHEEQEAQMAAYIAQQRAAQQQNALQTINGLDAATPATGLPQLSKYKEKLLHLIFGNRTLAESHREMMKKQREDEGIFRILREETEAAKKKDSVAALLGGSSNQELKVQSVMRVQESNSHLGSFGSLRGGSDDHGSSDNSDGSEAAATTHEGLPVPMAPADKLVDSDKNEYILSKPGDSSKKTVDTRLIFDLGIVIVASAIGGLIASAARQPILLGYLLGGSFIGPGCAKLIGQFIQIETLAQFGATFLLFALGVEFSVHKLRRVKYIAFLGGAMQLFLIMFCTSVFGVYMLELSVKQSVFVGAVLSMSSTTVVVKSLMETKQIATLCGQVMLGLLIVQDLFLSIMLALLNLAKVPFERLGTEALWLGVKFALLGAVVVACMYLWPLCLRLLDQSNSHDLFLLGLVALCVFLTVVSEKIIQSAEVGAFLSGILISSSPNASPELTHRALRLFSPIRDMFGALFFCSIGMLINPLFLLENALTIAMLVAATLLLKSILTFLIVRLFGYSLEISVRAGLGLSQIGEFAFVLASEGLSVGLLSKELYFLLLGTTAVSIFITPFILTVSMAIVKWFQLEDKKSHALGATAD